LKSTNERKDCQGKRKKELGVKKRSAKLNATKRRKGGKRGLQRIAQMI